MQLLKLKFVHVKGQFTLKHKKTNLTLIQGFKVSDTTNLDIGECLSHSKCQKVSSESGQNVFVVPEYTVGILGG